MTALHPFARRIEQIGSATLFLGDCRDVMPQVGTIDVIVTDPVWPNCPPNTIPGSNDPWGLWQQTCPLMPPCGRIVVCMRADSDPRFLSCLPDVPFFRSIQLPYVLPGYIGRLLGGDETAYWFGSPTRSQPGRRLVPGRAPAAQPFQRAPNGHPMSRAQVHFDWLVDRCTDDGETVLDMFMGSGTTGVACAKLGRKFIGIEVDPAYFEIACRRIDDAQRQADMFIEQLRGVTPGQIEERTDA